jgi:CubicO group peptidase (beta-lactamase class C family)
MARHSGLLLASFLAISCSHAEGAPFFQAEVAVAQGPPVLPYYPPPGRWERRSPARVGMDPALIDSAVAFAKSMESTAPRDLLAAHWASGYGREPLPRPLGPFKVRGGMTGIILRNGYLVAEWGEPDRVDPTFSITKSFLSSTLGVAWDRKLIPDLNGRVRDYVKTGEFDSEHNARITWDEMLRQTSDWEGTLWGKPDWADRPPENVPIEEYKKRVHAEPGTTYKYNDVRVNALAYAALQVWRRPLPEVLKEYVMDPIGASSAWIWHGYRNSWVTIGGTRMQSVVGGAHWGGGMWISARDLARFGLLTHRGGRWANKQILSEAWITQALTPTKPEPTYGFMNYFLNTAGADGSRPWPNATPKTFCHIGNGTNAVCSIPEYDLVVVARWIQDDALDGLLQRVIAAAANSK